MVATKISITPSGPLYFLAVGKFLPTQFRELMNSERISSKVTPDASQELHRRSGDNRSAPWPGGPSFTNN